MIYRIFFRDDTLKKKKEEPKYDYASRFIDEVKNAIPALYDRYTRTLVEGDDDDVAYFLAQFLGAKKYTKNDWNKEIKSQAGDVEKNSMKDIKRIFVDNDSTLSLYEKFENGSDDKKSTMRSLYNAANAALNDIDKTIEKIQSNRIQKSDDKNRQLIYKNYFYEYLMGDWPYIPTGHYLNKMKRGEIIKDVEWYNENKKNLFMGANLDFEAISEKVKTFIECVHDIEDEWKKIYA